MEMSDKPLRKQVRNGMLSSVEFERQQILKMRGVPMAYISNRTGPERATRPPGGRFAPIYSPFGRLDGSVYEFTT